MTRRKVAQNQFMVKQSSTYFVATDLTKDLYLKMKQQGKREIKKSFQIIEPNKKKVLNDSNSKQDEIKEIG